jgi:glycosyltransferase involved in cell wall biosynthesis
MKNEKNKRTWLIIAHCFNMDGRAASHTITDRIPFLMKKNILPVVLSAPTGYKDTKFPHYRVISPAPSGIRFEMRHIIGNITSDKTIRSILKAVLTLCCLPFYIIEKIFVHLDSQWSWFITASLKGIQIFKKYNPEVIYSTAGPPSTHLTAYILHKIFKSPWLAEVHDPLIIENEERKWQNYFFKKWLEKKIFNNAAAIIYFTENTIKEVCNRHVGHKKTWLIRPGANPPKIEPVNYKKRDKIHIGHFGSLASDRNLDNVIKALYALFQENPEYKNMICIDIYGSELDTVSKKTLKMYPIDYAMNLHGRLEYDPISNKSGREQVVEKMHKCDLLLLIHGEGSVCKEYIPSKFYEYLLTSRPVLSITDTDSELCSLLDTENDYIVSADNIPLLTNLFKELILKWQKKGLPGRSDNSLYTVSNSADKVVEIVNGII